MAAPELFVDTSAYLPFVYAGRTAGERALHSAVDREAREWLATGGWLVTTNLVIAETHQLLLVRHGRREALGFLRAFPAPATKVVTSAPELERRALTEWIERFQDQNFSLTDAVSFVVMKDRDVRRALALDRHFATAGFELVPARGGARPRE